MFRALDATGCVRLRCRGRDPAASAAEGGTMRKFVVAAAAVAALCGGAHASPSPPPPGEQAQSEAEKAYAALRDEYQKAYNEFLAAYRAAKTDEDRQKAAALQPKPQEWSAKFKELAAKHSKDPAAAL